MDIIFNIVDNIVPDSVILMTVVFMEHYNVSIGKDRNSITIYFYETDNREIIKFCGVPFEKKYSEMKKYILEHVGNTKLYHISGITSIENKPFLKSNFTITDNDISDVIVDISKKFY